MKEALVRQGVDQDLVTPLTWHSFRVFIPDCAYQLGIPRAQRQYLGNWQTESTADIYTREKRNVVVDIWSRFWERSKRLIYNRAGWSVKTLHTQIGMINHWTSQGTQRVSLTPMELIWSNRMLRLDSLSQKGAQIRPVPNILHLQDGHGQRLSHQSYLGHFSRRSLLTRWHLQ